jgi:hypothetical protein
MRLGLSSRQFNSIYDESAVKNSCFTGFWGSIPEGSDASLAVQDKIAQQWQ